MDLSGKSYMLLSTYSTNDCSKFSFIFSPLKNYCITFAVDAATTDLGTGFVIRSDI
jgi:hypothetical protein